MRRFMSLRLRLAFVDGWTNAFGKCPHPTRGDHVLREVHSLRVMLDGVGWFEGDRPTLPGA